jgi:hypothetical protein
VLFSDQTLGNPSIVKGDEGKVSPGRGDEHVLNTAKLLKVGSQLLLGQGGVLVADVHLFLSPLAPVGLPRVRDLESAIPSIDYMLLPPHLHFQLLLREPDEGITSLLVLALLHLALD